MDILGGVVLIDPDTGAAYSVGATVFEDPGVSFGSGILGGAVLIDPETGEPYKLGGGTSP